MLLPYRTDAYNDGLPVGTLALLAANVLVFAAVHLGWIAPEDWALEWGRVAPLAWIGRSFVHIGAWHLAWNLIFLWLFGHIVEGAVGTRAFLVLTLLVLLSSGGLEAYVYRSVEGGSFGASGLAFAFMTAACLLAPRTKIRILLWYFTAPSRLELPLLAVAAVLLALDLSTWLVGGAAALAIAEESGGTLPPAIHMIGAACGAGLAYVGLKLRLLDAGGWDALSKRTDTADRQLGEFVMPSTREAEPTTRGTAPRCKHCGRPRAAHLARCMYCGKS